MRLNSLLGPAMLVLAEAARNPKNAVLLSNVQSLTLRNGKQTSARRVTPIPQLKCIGGDAKGLYQVDVMRCKNAGSDYDDNNIQWTCTASLPEEFKLGSTDVICEGYDSPDDPYILKGSCGVEYRLALTSKGLEKYGERSAGEWDGSDKTSQAVGFIFWLLFFGVIIWMLFSACVVGRGTARDPNTWTGPRFDGGGGGGGGGWGGPGDDDAPPPYSPRPPYSQGRKSYSTNRTNTQGWRPGFWSGAVGGAAAGYMAGNWGNRGSNSTSSRGWGGSAGEGPSGTYRGSSPSTTRHESTGFGDTRRR